MNAGLRWNSVNSESICLHSYCCLLLLLHRMGMGYWLLLLRYVNIYLPWPHAGGGSEAAECADALHAGAAGRGRRSDLGGARGAGASDWGRHEQRGWRWVGLGEDEDEAGELGFLRGSIPIHRMGFLRGSKRDWFAARSRVNPFSLFPLTNGSIEWPFRLGGLPASWLSTAPHMADTSR
jgi:hypothetical protein